VVIGIGFLRGTPQLGGVESGGEVSGAEMVFGFRDPTQSPHDPVIIPNEPGPMVMLSKPGPVNLAGSDEPSVDSTVGVFGNGGLGGIGGGNRVGGRRGVPGTRLFS